MNPTPDRRMADRSASDPDAASADASDPDARSARVAPTARLPRGSYPAMLTAFQDDGSFDWAGVDRLADSCIETGAAGIFACGSSAEIREMDDEEKGELAERIVRHVAGRVPIVAGAITGGSLGDQAELIRRVHGAGVDVVAIAVCQLAGQDEDDQLWMERAGALLDQIPDGVRLSFYECPWPYHRLLGDEAIEWVARTGRFHFLKDTSCDIGVIRRRLEILRGSRLQLLNANTATLLESLQAGAEGFCGIGANYMPELYAWLCRHFADQPETAAEVHGFLDNCLDLTEGDFYPASAKEYLRLRGHDISLSCRKTPTGAPADFRERQADMRLREEKWLERLVG